MSEIHQARTDRIENILKPSRFFGPASTRRAFMERLLTVGGGAALGVAAGAGMLGTRVKPALAATDSDILNFGNAAVGAERIGIAFYANALGMSASSGTFNVSCDTAKGTLLNSAHRAYFEAALNQETQHLNTLSSLGLTFPITTFGFPDGTFSSAKSMLAFGEQLEDVFIGAYLGAIKVSASVGHSLGIAVAELAAQILGIECEHRVLIRDIAGLTPPNDRFFEGDQAPGSDMTLGNTGPRSTVYANGDAAVLALLALGVEPNKACP